MLRKLLWLVVAIFSLAALSLPVATDMLNPIVARAACGTSLCVQMKDAENAGAGSTRDVTFDSNVAANHLITVGIYFCGNSGCSSGVDSITIASVTDTLSHTYSSARRRNFNSNGEAVAIYYTCGTSSGADTVTVTLSGGTPFYLWASIVEWSGVETASCLDQTGDAAVADTSITVSTDGSTSQNNELVYGVAKGATDIAGTSEALNASNNGSVKDQYKTVTSTGVQSLTWNQSFAIAGGAISTFKEAAAAGGAGLLRLDLRL